jgi:predicted nucleic acid-binding protein
VIGKVLVDTGPLIALIDRHDRHHAWVTAQFDQILPPLLTCEAVLTETCYLAPRAGTPAEEPFLLLERGVLRLAFDLSDNFGQVSSLMKRYASIPMALADACLVRMSELVAESVVMTLDADFRIYRRHKRQKIPLLLPASE